MRVSRSRCAPSTTSPPPPHRRHRNRCPCGECCVRREFSTPGEVSFPAKAAPAVGRRRGALRWGEGQAVVLWGQIQDYLQRFLHGNPSYTFYHVVRAGPSNRSFSSSRSRLFLACRSFTPTSSPHAISLHCCLSVTGIAFRYPLVRSRYPIVCKISGEFTRIRSHVRIVIAARNEPLV